MFATANLGESTILAMVMFKRFDEKKRFCCLCTLNCAVPDETAADRLLCDVSAITCSWHPVGSLLL
jgi:hypothetical protein